MFGRLELLALLALLVGCERPSDSATQALIVQDSKLERGRAIEDALPARSVAPIDLGLDDWKLADLIRAGGAAEAWRMVKNAAIRVPASDARLRELRECLGADTPPTRLVGGQDGCLLWMCLVHEDIARNEDGVLLFFDRRGRFIDCCELQIERGQDVAPLVDSRGRARYFSYETRVWGTGVLYTCWQLLRAPVLDGEVWTRATGVFSGLREGYSGGWFLGGLYDSTAQLQAEFSGINTKGADDLNETKPFCFRYATKFVADDTLLIHRAGCFDCSEADDARKGLTRVSEFFVLEDKSDEPRPAF